MFLLDIHIVIHGLGPNTYYLILVESTFNNFITIFYLIFLNQTTYLQSTFCSCYCFSVPYRLYLRLPVLKRLINTKHFYHFDSLQMLYPLTILITKLINKACILITEAKSYTLYL